MRAANSSRKFFLCTGECVRADQLRDYPRSHIIGELRYIEDQGQMVSALAVYANSLPTNAMLSVEMDICVEIIGDARRIKCRFPNCHHHLKRWQIGRTAFMQLQRRYGKAML